MLLRRSTGVARALLLFAAGLSVWTPAASQRPCNTEDEYLSAAGNFEYVYNASVDIQHTAGGRTSTAGFSFSCAVIINGEQPCFYSLKLATCRLDDRADHPDRASRHHSFNRLLKRRHVHFRLSGGELDRLLADPEESPFVTNVRRGVLNVLRVSRPLLDTEGQVTSGPCERTVSRLADGRRRVQRSRGCDPAQDVPSASTFFSLLPSMGWVEDRFSVSSSCDYDVSRDRVLGASCRQTWQLSQPTADDVQVVVTQELSRFTERAADPPLTTNTQEVPAGLVMENADPYIDVDGASVFSRLRELVAVSTPMMTPETPHKFTALLRALRRDYQSPLRMASNCTDCTRFEKSMMAALAPSAVLQCGSAPCLQEVAGLLRSGHLTGGRLTSLFLTWQWSQIRDVQTAHRMYALCELAPTRWCLLGLATALRRSSRRTTDGSLQAIADRLRRKAADLAGRQCRGDDGAVLLALKTFSNMGELAFSSGTALSLVRTCMMDASRPVMISSEAVRTLSTVKLPPKFAKNLRAVMENEQYPLLTRQLAYLALLQRFPSERTFRTVLTWASAARADPLSGFVLRHWKRWPLSAPHRDLMLKVAAAAGLHLSEVAEDPFNSPSVSSLREIRLDKWLKMALPAIPEPAAGASLYRLHGSSFLPHLLRLDTTLSLGAGEMTPVQVELRAVGLERFAHDLVRDPEFDPTTVRGVLREVASAVLAGFGGKFGGDSFVTPSEVEPEPGTLRLSPAVAAWLQKLLQLYQAQAALPEARPRAVLTVTVMDGQVAYLTAEDLIRRLQTPEPPPDPYHILGEKLFHTQTLFKFIESQHRMPLAVGLPLEVMADGNVAANAAAEVSSRLHNSYRNMREKFNGDAQLSASAGVSLVLGLEVALPPFARAGLQLNTTLYTPFSLNLSYAIINRTIQLTAPKPDHRRTLLLLRHGAQLRQGEELRPSPAAEMVSRRCVQQAIYTGLLVCRQLHHSGRLGLTAPVSYHVTGENPDPEFHTYTLDVWSSARDDGYLHGGLFHIVLHKPAAAAQELRVRIGFRLMPINFNPMLFHSGQRANTTLDLMVGEFGAPIWHLHLLRAHEERDDVLFTETRGWVLRGGITMARADLEQVGSLPWVAGTSLERRHELSFDGVRMGDRLVYWRKYRAAGRAGGDADFAAELRYRTNHSSEGGSESTVYRNTRVERLLAPQFFKVEHGGSEAWLRLNYTRRLTTNDELTELNWSHAAQASTVGVTLAGLLNLTSTADSSALLTANLTASETESGRTLMYTDATADYSRHREGADTSDRVRATLSCPSAAYSGRLRLDWLSDGRLLANASAARAAGWESGLTAALEPAPPGRRLTARLHLPGEETATLQAEFSTPSRPRPWLHWYLDEYAFSQTSRLWWSRYDMELASSLQLQNGSHTLDVAADLSLAHAQKPASASSAVRLRWDKRAHLWDSNVALDTPFIVFTNNITSNVVGSSGMERQFLQSASSKYFYLLDHQVQGSVRTDCLSCPVRQRDFNMKLAHKWMKLHTATTRNLSDDGASGGGLQKLNLKLDSTADFLPSMQCVLKSNGNFDMSLTLPSMGPQPELDIKYTKQLPGPRSRSKGVTRAVDVSIRPDPRGQAVPALHLSVETTPGDPSRLAAELQVQPSLWLAAGSGLVQKLQMTALGARRAVYAKLRDGNHWLNQLLRPLTGTNTVLEFIPQIPHRLKMAGSWVVHRLAALLSPWHSVTGPVFQTARNLYRAAAGLVARATAGVRQRASERAMGALPRQLLAGLMQRLATLQKEAWKRLPFKFQMSVTPTGRQRLEITHLPDYANVETFWNLSAVVRERLSRPTVLGELLARPDDRRPLAALWSDGRALALSGHSFVLPAVDGCRHLLLADVQQRAFSVVRTGRHLVMTFLDCNVIVNDRGQAHVERFNVSLPERFRTAVEAAGGRLTVTSRVGLEAEVDLACGASVFRLDAWMAPRTAGLLADADRAGWSAAEAGSRFSLDGDCAELDGSAGPELEIDGCGRIETAECTLLTSLESRARQHDQLCDSPSSSAAVRLTLSGPEAPPAPVRVLLAVADASVPASAVRRLTAALHRQLTEQGQRSVLYALVADSASAGVSWVEDPARLELEGHKLSADGLVGTLHAVMTERPFGGPPAHRVLVVFAPSDQLEGGASLTGLRRQLWSRRVALHLVTPLQQLSERYQLPLPLHGLTARGGVITADRRHTLTVPPHQGDLGQLVAATSGAVWESSLLLSATEGATSVELVADAVWQRVSATAPGPPLSGSGTAQPPSAAARLGGGAAPLTPPLLLPLLLVLPPLLAQL